LALKVSTFLGFACQKNKEVLQTCGQIWPPAQQVIRSQGKSVVFGDV